MKVIAKIHTDFPEKFGVPRQSGSVASLTGKIVFEPEYRVVEAVRGLEGYSHIWLLWQFSQAMRETWSPTVRPPRLGGNQRLGVFATRSPYRPNPIGLSSVRLEKIAVEEQLGPVLYISGADLLDGTPIYDIKPYLPFTDSHPEAIGGFSDACAAYGLQVEIPEELLAKIPLDKQEALLGVLAQDPRPAYQNDPQRIYGLKFGVQNICFRVQENVLSVTAVEAAGQDGEKT